MSTENCATPGCGARVGELYKSIYNGKCPFCVATLRDVALKIAFAADNLATLARNIREDRKIALAADGVRVVITVNGKIR